MIYFLEIGKFYGLFKGKEMLNAVNKATLQMLKSYEKCKQSTPWLGQTALEIFRAAYRITMFGYVKK